MNFARTARGAGGWGGNHGGERKLYLDARPVPRVSTFNGPQKPVTKKCSGGGGLQYPCPFPVPAPLYIFMCSVCPFCP